VDIENQITQVTESEQFDDYLLNYSHKIHDFTPYSLIALFHHFIINKCNKINGPKDVAIGQIKSD
jgi:hypothetical protein